jgi:hypothetical protein
LIEYIYHNGKKIPAKTELNGGLFIVIEGITPQLLPARQRGIPYFIGDSRSYCKPFVNSLLFLSFPLFSFSTLQRYAFLF